MAKKAKSWYAWHDALGNGGICRTWAECEAACKGKHGEKHKGFETREEAWAFAFPGVPMPAETTVVSVPSPSQDKRPEMDSLPQIDPARISRVEPAEKVNRFCSVFGFERLSKDQRRAVQATDGKVLLFAVPGSGKTTVLIARIGYMVHACGIAPGSIVSLTFTKASAAEMKERYQKRFPDDTLLGGRISGILSARFDPVCLPYMVLMVAVQVTAALGVKQLVRNAGKLIGKITG